MSLSDKRVTAFNGILAEPEEFCYEERYVREAVNELKESIVWSPVITDVELQKAISDLINKRIDEIFGSELI